MRKTGRETASLTAQLQMQTQEQRTELAELMRSELQKLATDLKQSSTDALTGFESDIQTQLRDLQEKIRSRKRTIQIDLDEIREKPKLWIGISAATAALIASLVWSVPTIWTAWKLSPVSVERNESGLFLILPQTSEQGWRCGERLCVKLED